MVLVAASTVGWVGAVGTVGAYAMVSQRRLSANSLRFQTINVACAAALCLSALSVHNWPSMMSNLVWMLIGLHALMGAREALRTAVTTRLRSVRLHHDDEPQSQQQAEADAIDAVILAA
jgi:hypothetical protein